MAAIGKIREHGGFLTVIIGIALASFVIGPKALDLVFKSGPEFDRTAIALVNGEKIGIDYFNQKVEEQVENFKEQNKKDNLTSEERYTLTMQVWDMVKKETLLHQQELEIGLVKRNENNVIGISRAEYNDMIIGKNPHSLIVQNFSDQKTGQFNPQYVKQFLTNVEQGLQSEDPKQKEQAMVSDKQWRNLAKYIKEDRLTQKYNNLIKKAYYIPTTLAEQEYNDRNSSANIRYTAVRYGTIKDEDAVPTDADYQEYFDAHQNEFKQTEETRKIDYVVWNVRPSQKDIQDIQKQINSIATEFQTIEAGSVPIYVNSYRDSRYDSTWLKEGAISPFIDSLAFNSEVGTIMGPWTENNAYSVARIMSSEMRPDSMRASYILVTYSGAYGASDSITRTRIGAQALADSLLEVAKSEDFESLAKDYSDDSDVKKNGGDLGWFADGQTAPEINLACLNNNVGDIVVTEGTFGFLVMKVTGKQESIKKVRIAQINIPITFSKETHNMAFTEATRYASQVSDAVSFDSISTNQQLNIMKGDFLKEMDADIMGIPNSRSIIRWMFGKEVVKGSISDVFDYDSQVIVAILSDVREKGIPKLEDVKEFIKPLVISSVKAKLLISKLAGATDINQFAIDNKILVDTSAIFTYNSYSLPKYGPEQNVQGHMFASQTGSLQGPLKGDQGVYVFVVDGMTPAPANTVDYRFTKEQIRAVFEQMVDQAVYNAIDEAAEINDFRKYVY